MAATGIRDHAVAPRSPCQNGRKETMIGSIRPECLDHIVILGENHLRRVPKACAAYGPIVCIPILGGLHHQYPGRAFGRRGNKDSPAALIVL